MTRVRRESEHLRVVAWQSDGRADYFYVHDAEYGEFGGDFVIVRAYLGRSAGKYVCASDGDGCKHAKAAREDEEQREAQRKQKVEALKR